MRPPDEDRFAKSQNGFVTDFLLEIVMIDPKRPATNKCVLYNCRSIRVRTNLQRIWQTKTNQALKRRRRERIK